MSQAQFSESEKSVLIEVLIRTWNGARAHHFKMMDLPFFVFERLCNGNIGSYSKLPWKYGKYRVMFHCAAAAIFRKLRAQTVAQQYLHKDINQNIKRLVYCRYESNSKV